MKLLKVLIFMTLLCIVCMSCKVINYNTHSIKRAVALDNIKGNLDLNPLEINLLKPKDTIVAELYLALKDSVKANNLKQHLDSFYSKKYNAKKLKVSIQMERYVKKSGGSFRLSDTLDPNNAFHVKNMKEFDSIVKLMRKRFGKSKLKVTTSTRKKDSLKN